LGTVTYFCVLVFAPSACGALILRGAGVGAFYLRRPTGSARRRRPRACSSLLTNESLPNGRRGCSTPFWGGGRIASSDWGQSVPRRSEGVYLERLRTRGREPAGQSTGREPGDTGCRIRGFGPAVPVVRGLPPTALMPPRRVGSTHGIRQSALIASPHGQRRAPGEFFSMWMRSVPTSPAPRPTTCTMMMRKCPNMPNAEKPWKTRRIQRRTSRAQKKPY
jgi:hypothetical protein